MAGRGGAGNIEAAQAQANKALTTSQDRADLGGLDPSPIAQKLEADGQSQRTHQDWALTGRGGAGNYYSPREVEATGSFTSTVAGQAVAQPTSNDHSQPSVPIPKENKSQFYPDAPTSTGAYSGRGGAGNHVGDLPSSTTEESPRLREAIDRDLEKGMPQEPAKAHFDGREKAAPFPLAQKDAEE